MTKEDKSKFKFRVEPGYIIIPEYFVKFKPLTKKEKVKRFCWNFVEKLEDLAFYIGFAFSMALILHGLKQ